MSSQQALFSEAIKSGNVNLYLCENFSSTSRYENFQDDKNEKFGAFTKSTYNQRSYKFNREDGPSQNYDNNNYHSKFKPKDFNQKVKFQNGKNFNHPKNFTNGGKPNDQFPRENSQLNTNSEKETFGSTGANFSNSNNQPNYNKNQESSFKFKSDQEKQFSKDPQISPQSYLNKVFNKNNTKPASAYKGKNITHSLNAMGNFPQQTQDLSQGYNINNQINGTLNSKNSMPITTATFHPQNSFMNLNRNMFPNFNNLNSHNMSYMPYSVMPVNNFFSQNEPFNFTQPSLNYIPKNIYPTKQAHDHKKHFSVTIKLKSDEKNILVFRGEDYHKKASQFCHKNKLSQTLIKPIYEAIMSTANCLDSLMRKELTPLEFHQLDSIKENYQNYENNIKDPDTFLNISSFTLSDESQEFNDILSRSF